VPVASARETANVRIVASVELVEIPVATRYRSFITYRRLHEEESHAVRENEAADRARRKIHIELYPRGKFKGYSLPYYKRGYRSLE